MPYSAIQAALNLLAGTSGLGETAAANAAVGRLVGVNEMQAGEHVFSRLIATSDTAAVTSQGLYLSFFRSNRTEAVTQVTVATGGTAAAATPTICRIGVFAINTPYGIDAAAAQVAVTPNDTTLFAAANTSYTKAFSAGFTKTINQWYAVGLLVVSGAALPTFRGLAHSANNATNTWATAPRVSGVITGQADMPSTIDTNSVASAVRAIQFRLN